MNASETALYEFARTLIRGARYRRLANPKLKGWRESWATAPWDREEYEIGRAQVLKRNDQKRRS